MAKRKPLKEKSPIKLRSKKLANGNSSLYLDIYLNGERKKEYLKLYLVPETNTLLKEQNRKTLEIAETIKSERLITLQKSKSTTLQEVQSKYLKIPFVSYMENELDNISSIRTQNYVRRYRVGIAWVKRFDSITTLECIDKLWVQRFIYFLSTTPGSHGKILNPNTAHEYLLYVANTLNTAVRKGILQSNPTKSLSASDRPKKYESKRTFLTFDEIKKLLNTPSPPKYNPIRQAFLFSCFCGLRYSDLLQLRWCHILDTKEGTIIDKQIQKTKERLILPLSNIAISFLPERREQDSFVFTLPKSIATTEMYLKVWTEFAGIDKHVTFHTARHSFAVNILTNGGDIYTLSKLLGHKKVATTQIYADVLEKTKQKTMDLLNSFEESDNPMK